ncbi:MAG TPA: carboxypeptidase-like regulatory domain-containing protein [Planctomycetota bacterium]
MSWALALGVLSVVVDRPLAADGDVSVSVDAAGDLWLLGDALDNGIRLEAGGDDPSVFHVAGLDGTTTVNGLPGLTISAPGTRMLVLLGDGDNVAWLGTDYGGEPSCCRRELLVVCGPGNDEIVMIGQFLWTTADLGPGDDSVRVTEGASGIAGSLRMGTGNDLIWIDGFNSARGTFELGHGNDQFLIGGSSTLDGVVELGPGDDVLFLGCNDGDLDLRGGDGQDTFEIADLAAGALVLSAGAGEDSVRITGDRNSSGSRPIDPMHVDLGRDDDRLAVGQAEIASAVFDGGLGRDQYLDLGSNVFLQGAPELISFEYPKGTPGSGVARHVTIAGRVVDDHGRGVADARVLLPQLGAVAVTDPTGAFAFAPLSDERDSLELVVGDVVDGSRRYGAAMAELVPIGVAHVGDVAVQALRPNVILFGTPRYSAAAMEENLRTLGLRPQEVSALATPPQELAPYGVIWHVGGPIAAEDRTRLADFVRAGGGLFLAGGASANASVELLVNELVLAGGIGVGARGTNTNGLYSFQLGAAGGVALRPNPLQAFYRSAFSRFITGTQPRNELIVMSTSPDVPAAVWDARELVGRRGRLLLVMDTTWMAPGESLDPIENFQRFLVQQPKAQTSR